MFAALALIISAVATGVGTFMSVQGQRTAADQANATAKYNADVQRQQAAQEMEVAKENARRKQRENSRILARQRAMVARQGLAMEGTPLEILGETATTLQRDILDLGYQAQQRVRSLQVSANMGLWEGKNQANAIKTQSLTTGLKGVATMASGFLDSNYGKPKKTPSVG